LTACRRLSPDLRKLYDLYESRIDDYSINPAEPGWDGVFIATSK
jgi:uncharacterized protein YeeX (DUF496 family)